MSQKILAASVFALLFVSAWYLFAVNERGLDPDHDKNWWNLSFAEPATTSSLAFVIVNHSDGESFTYEVKRGLDTLESGTASVPRGKSETVSVTTVSDPSRRTTVIVSDGTVTQEIFR